jgi:hypothetical protein
VILPPSGSQFRSRLGPCARLACWPPFRVFSFVVKAICREIGVTGVREAVVMARAQADGRIRSPEPGTASGAIEGWELKHAESWDPFMRGLPDGRPRAAAQDPTSPGDLSGWLVEECPRIRRGGRKPGASGVSHR